MNGNQITVLTPAQVELLKRTYAKTATDDELALFLSVAQARGLNPFAGQIVFVKRKQLVDGDYKEVGAFQVTIDGLRSMADGTHDYAPGPAPEFEYDKDGKLVTAVAHVRKWVHGSWVDVVATARYSEYMQTKADGSPIRMWAKMPHNQLAKCAEALAIRKAFPQQTEGLMLQEDNEEGQAQIVEGQVLAVTEGVTSEGKANGHKVADLSMPLAEYIKTDKGRGAFWSQAKKALAMSHDEVHAALGVDHLNEYAGTLGKAVEQMKKVAAARPPIVETPEEEIR